MDALGDIDPSYRSAVDYAIVAIMLRSGKRLLHRPGVIAAFDDDAGSKIPAALRNIAVKQIGRVRRRYGVGIARCELLVAAIVFGL